MTSTGKNMALAMHGHSVWANRQLLNAAAQLSASELDREVPGAYGTVRGIFVHMMGAQRSWLRRWQGMDPLPPADPASYVSIDAIRTAWEALDAETAAYLASLPDENLAQVVHLKFWSGAEGDAFRWQAILHQAFHQHQHRGEIAAMLTTLGHSPGELDFLDYFDTLAE